MLSRSAHSEVAQGVRRICQIGMKRQMHGLRIRHDRRRLLFLSPPQTRRLRVQVPLCGIQQRVGARINTETVWFIIPLNPPMEQMAACNLI